MTDFHSINEAAIPRLPDLLPELLPGGVIKSREYVCGDLGGNPGRSFSVNLASGKWADFATDQKGGDPISLVAAIRGVSQGEAARELATRLRINYGTSKTTVKSRPKTDSWKTLPADHPPASIIHPAHGRPSAIWEYRSPVGELLGIVCRFDPGEGKKEIMPYTYGTDSATGHTEWRWKSWPEPRPLYGLDRLTQRPDAPVVVFEGEKSADTGQRLLPSCVCITWPGGSSSVAKTDWSPLKGHRVAMWPDADLPGHKAGEDVANAVLQVNAKEVFIIDVPPGKANGWDIADAEAEGWTPKQTADWIKVHRQKVESIAPPGKRGELGENPSRAQKTPGLKRGESGLILDDNSMANLLRVAKKLLAIENTHSTEPYPVEALGPLATACKTLSSEGQVPVEMAGQCLLTTAALLAQSHANVRTLGGIKPLSLYGLTVAESGEGKSSADDTAQHAVTEWQKSKTREYDKAMMQYEGEKATRKKNDHIPDAPREPYRIMRDGTVEGIRRSFRQGASSQGVFSSEAAVMLAGYGMSPDHRAKSAGNFNSLWDSGEISVARGLDGRLQLYDRRLSLHWLVQPDVAYAAIHDPLLSSIGFWPRFLLACPPPSPPLLAKKFEAERHSDIVKFWAVCAEMLKEPLDEDCSRLPVITPSAEAEQLACRFYEAMQREAKITDGMLVDVKPFAVRATEQAFRVAGVLAVFTEKKKIDAELIRNGIAIAGFSLESWRTVFGDRDETAARSSAFLMYSWLIKQPGQQATGSAMLQIGPKKLRSKSRRDTALAVLQQVGLIHNDHDRWFAEVQNERA